MNIHIINLTIHIISPDAGSRCSIQYTNTFVYTNTLVQHSIMDSIHIY